MSHSSDELVQDSRTARLIRDLASQKLDPSEVLASYEGRRGTLRANLGSQAREVSADAGYCNRG